MASKEITASSGSPIPAAYDKDDTQSAALVSDGASSLRVNNGTAIDLFYTIGDAGTTPGTTDEELVRKGAVVTDDGLIIEKGKVIYIRGRTAITDDRTVHLRSWIRRQ